MDGSPTVEDLAYDTNEQRVKFFTAIGSGRGAAYSTGNADNLDNTNFGVGGSNAGIVSSEVLNMHKGVDVAFNKFGLIEFILQNVWL
jgi:energy-converting hydrogenase Eha subunit H